MYFILLFSCCVADGMESVHKGRITAICRVSGKQDVNFLSSFPTARKLRGLPLRVLVAISNNGVLLSNRLKLVIYDSACHRCLPNGLCWRKVAFWLFLSFNYSFIYILTSTPVVVQAEDRWKHYSLNSEDDIWSGCRNVSHQQQFCSEIRSPRYHRLLPSHRRSPRR